MDVHQREVEKLLAGDQGFITTLYQEVFPSIVRLIRSNSGNDEEAKDLFQDALMATYKKARDERFVLTCSLKSFIYAVSRNIWLYRLRDKRKRKDETDIIPEDTVSDVDIEKLMDDYEKVKLYKKHFKKLTEDCKQVLKLHFEGNAMDDIAIHMGYGSKEYAKKKKFKCKEKLIQSIKADPVYHELMGGSTKTY
ncbi:MAG: sigma-70 family RNA polymerase sigma factor [Bacteroidota bacterium]